MIYPALPKSRFGNEINEYHQEVQLPQTLSHRNTAPQGEAIKCFCRK